MINLINRLCPNPPETLKETILLLNEIIKAKPSKEYLEEFIRPAMKNSWVGASVLTSNFKGNSRTIDLLYLFGKNIKHFKPKSFCNFVDFYFANHPFNKGVLERVEFLKSKILNCENKKIASIACGSGIEFGGYVNESNKIFCYDIDGEALKKLNDRKIHNLATFKQDIIRCKFPTKFDLIYSAGLFDYFDLKRSKRVLKRLFNALEVGGELIIGNADIDAPTKEGMEILLDWKLIYKSKFELLSLADGLDCEAQIRTDSAGVFNYLILKSC
jgi:hypothetical protein